MFTHHNSQLAGAVEDTGSWKQDGPQLDHRQLELLDILHLLLCGHHGALVNRVDLDHILTDDRDASD